MGWTCMECGESHSFQSPIKSHVIYTCQTPVVKEEVYDLLQTKLTTTAAFAARLMVALEFYAEKKNWEESKASGSTAIEVLVTPPSEVVKRVEAIEKAVRWFQENIMTLEEGDPVLVDLLNQFNRMVTAALKGEG